MENKRLIGFYDYTVVLTYCGMLSAFTGIVLSMNGQFLKAIVCLMIAGVCDMFDGAVASTKERNVFEKTFGIQIDSLSDLISFGVFPALFVYLITGQNRWAGVVGGVYTLCALIRLAFYNVQEEERQRVSAGKRETYLGFPVTTVAMLLPMEYIVDCAGVTFGQQMYILGAALLSIGFVSGVKIKKPGLVGKICILTWGLVELGGVIYLLNCSR